MTRAQKQAENSTMEKISRVTPPTLSNRATAPPAVSVASSAGSEDKRLLCLGAHIDLQFGICCGSANSRQNQTPSSTSWTAEKCTAYLPPAPSVAACWGRVAAVPGPRGGGLQKRRKRCCLAFLTAPLRGHWVVLGEQEQNTVCETNTELKLKNSNTRFFPCNVFNIFSTSYLDVSYSS